MSDLLHKLANNESVLLMYLADELSAEERAEVEQLLRTDAGLRRMLEALTSEQNRSRAVLETLDAEDPPTLTDVAAQRQARRLVHQWSVQRLSRPAAPAASGLRYPWWSYPLASAAAILLAFLVWWGNTDSGTYQSGIAKSAVAAREPQVIFPSEEESAVLPIEREELVENLRRSLDNSNDYLREIRRSSKLYTVEHEIAVISELTGAGPLVFTGDGTAEEWLQ